MVKILTKEAMEKLTTKRLLAYKNKLMQVPETEAWEDDEQISKSDDEWKRLYSDVKDVLSTREHVE